MAVIAVIITAPAGAILTNTLGPIWLNDDSNDSDGQHSVGAQAVWDEKDQMFKSIKKGAKTQPVGNDDNGLEPK